MAEYYTPIPEPQYSTPAPDRYSTPMPQADLDRAQSVQRPPTAQNYTPMPYEDRQRLQQYNDREMEIGKQQQIATAMSMGLPVTPGVFLRERTGVLNIAQKQQAEKDRKRIEEYNAKRQTQMISEISEEQGARELQYRVDTLKEQAEYTKDQNGGIVFKNLTPSQQRELQDIQGLQGRVQNVSVMNDPIRQEGSKLSADINFRASFQERFNRALSSNVSFLSSTSQQYQNSGDFKLTYEGEAAETAIKNRAAYLKLQAGVMDPKPRQNRVTKFFSETFRPITKRTDPILGTIKENVGDWNRTFNSSVFGKDYRRGYDMTFGKVIKNEYATDRLRNNIVGTTYATTAVGGGLLLGGGTLGGSRLLFGAKSLAVSTAVAGGITYGGLKVGEITASDEQKAFIRDRQTFRGAMQAGYSAEAAAYNDSWGGDIKAIASEWAPAGKLYGLGNKNAYLQGVREYYKNKGYTGKQLDIAVSAAQRQRNAGLLSEIPALLGVEASSELTGRMLFRKALSGKAKNLGASWIGTKAAGVSASNLAVAGFVEGSTQYFAQTVTRYEDFKTSSYINQGLIGSATAATVGSIIAGSSARGAKTGKMGKVGRVTQGFAYIADPLEWFGDKATDIFQAGSRRFSGGVYGVPSFVSTTTSEGDSVIMKNQLYKRGKPWFISTPSNVPTQTETVSNSFTSAPISSRSSTFTFTASSSVPTFSNTFTTASSVPTNTPTSIMSNVPTNIPTNVPSNVPSLIPSSVPTNVQSNVPANVPSQVNNVVNVPVTVFDPPAGGFPGLFLPFGSGKGLFGGQRKKLDTRYLPSFDALVLGIKSRKAPKNKIFTGQEIRPIIVG